jgi:transcriptional regulator with XRE-family HTH domain
MWVEVMRALCDDLDRGTREGLILVSKAPPSTTPRDAATRPATDGRTKTNVDGAESVRRRELADFLRNRRAAIAPEEVGLPGGGRRRTPGLRREEVAQLAGVGTTWYTWLEQARDVRASHAVLDALADALKLTPAERRHLVLLGRGEPAPPAPPVTEEVSAPVRRLIDNLGLSPAYLLGRRWDYLAWNDAMAAVFGDPADVPPEHRNQLWLFFTDPARRALMPDWKRTGRVLLSRFRADYARHVGDPAFDQLVFDLQEASPEFRKWWPAHEVKGDTDGRKEIIHPIEGRMLFEHAVFMHMEHTEQRFILYTPLPDEDTPAKMERLLRAR